MIEVQIGDSRRLIHGLKDKSIDCVVTSPPYWRLRDYKTEPIIFDGRLDCEHEWKGFVRSGISGGNSPKVYSRKGNLPNMQAFDDQEQTFCSLCGAWHGQLGLEPTPELFIKHLLDFFDDVKLKLKDEGNCFVNLGDSYSTRSGGMNQGSWGKLGCDNERGAIKQSKTNLPDKCLCMIPPRFAWGMIERGWILRNSIIWAKPNHMPESVTDRLTKSHEVIYHFVKQQKYYYDLDAIREPHKEPNGSHNSIKQIQCYTYGKTSCFRGLESYNHNGKNPGDVWTITTQPFAESHFAVFPLELVRRPIIAGCPIGGMVLDPFAGSGTVGEFCRHNERNAILFELNPEYKKLIEDRAMLNVPELGSFASKEAP